MVLRRPTPPAATIGTTVVVTTGVEDPAPGARVWPERVVDGLVDRAWAGADADLTADLGPGWCLDVHPLIDLTGPAVHWELVLPGAALPPARLNRVRAALERHWSAAHRQLH